MYCVLCIGYCVLGIVYSVLGIVYCVLGILCIGYCVLCPLQQMPGVPIPHLQLASITPLDTILGRHFRLAYESWGAQPRKLEGELIPELQSFGQTKS